MASRKEKKVKQDLSGTGKVLEESQVLTTVQYQLREIQEYIITSTKKGTDKTPGLKEWVGVIDAPSHELHDLFGKENLTLELEDGKKINFFLKNTDGELAISGGLRDE